MRQKFRLLLLIFAQALLSSAHADPQIQKLRGTYEAKTSQTISLRTIALGEDNQAVAAEIVVAAKGCSGALSGLGASDGKAVKVRPYMASEPSSQACEVTISLDNSGKVATISEENCLDFHGAQCAFSGELRAR
jgi:hypothetical protein